MSARSNRGVRRALIHRNRRYAGVTTGDSVITPWMSQILTMRFRPSGSKVTWGSTGGSIPLVFAMKIGSGPEGSSLYMDYRCSMGCGVEKGSGSLISVVSANLGDLAFSYLSIPCRKVDAQQCYGSTYNREKRRGFREDYEGKDGCTNRFSQQGGGDLSCIQIL